MSASTLASGAKFTRTSAPSGGCTNAGSSTLPSLATLTKFHPRVQELSSSNLAQRTDQLRKCRVGVLGRELHARLPVAVAHAKFVADLIRCIRVA